jgi:hypothetical protein
MILRIDCYLMIILCLGMKERSRRHKEEGLEAWRTSEGVQIMMKDQTKLSSSLPRSLGPVCLELVTQDAYGLRFRCSIYGWKAYLIRKPTQVVPCQKLFGINRNRRNKSPSRICQGAMSPFIGPFGPCNVSALPRDTNRGPLTFLSLYNQ